MQYQRNRTPMERAGYFIDGRGTVRDADDHKFVFTTQEQYEQLGEAVTDEVYRMLVSKCNLIKTQLKPLNEPPELPENLSFIYVSPDCQKKETLLVLLHGSGVVRAGQWARSLIINNNMRCGSQFPYIMKALELGWGVVVMNTNHVGTNEAPLKYSRTPVEHALTAWKAWVETSEAETIYVVAHSRGGVDISAVMKQHGADERVAAVVLTDSWFTFSDAVTFRRKPLIVINFQIQGFQNDAAYVVRNFVPNRVHNLFSGTRIHEWTNHCAFEAIFNIFEKKINVQNFRAVMLESKYMVTSERDVVPDPDRESSESSEFEDSDEVGPDDDVPEVAASGDDAPDAKRPRI